MTNKSKFNLIPLNYKLALLGLAPTLALVFFFLQIEDLKSHRVQTTENFIDKVAINVAVEQLTDALQQERRFSISKLIRSEDASLLNEYQLSTDRAINRLDSSMGKGIDSNYHSFTFIDQIDNWRNDIAKNNTTYLQIFNNYQKVSDRIRSFTAMDANLLNLNQDLNYELQFSNALSNLINHLIAMRLSVYFFYSDPEHNQFDFNAYNLNYELFESYKRELDFILAHNKNTRSKLNDNRNITETLNVLAAIYADQQVPENYDEERWWELTSLGVDALKADKDSVINSIEEKARDINQDEVSALMMSRIILVICLVFTLILILFITGNIANHLFELQQIASKIALGYTQIEFPTFAHDAIGVVATSIKQIDLNNQKLSKAAEKIGRNDFDVEITPRGKHDLIGNSLLQMKNSLERHAIKDKQEIWIQTGVSQITSVMINKRQIAELGDELLPTIIKYINGAIGTFYLTHEGQELKLASTYGIDAQQKPPATISYGNTLLGKSLLDQEPTLLTDLPADYLKISTSLGSTKPTWILIIPLVYDGLAQGVIEIASIQSPDATIMDLAKQIMDPIASTIYEIKSRMRLKELLEETQSQSEELQAQHTELENLNIELEAQAQRLQASEEELRVQQEELLDSNQELEIRSQALEDKNQVILERNLEIQQKAEALELSTRYKSEFLANMSHELRTPLNSILLLSHLLADNNEGNLTGDQVEYAQVIQNSGNGLLSLIDEILDLSKIESGKMALEFEATSLQGVADELLALFTPLAKDKGLMFSVVIDEGLPKTIKTDNLRLQQILRNLLSNALKFTSKGRVDLHISTEQTGSEQVRFSVIDTGIGIPKEKQEIIFEAFQQADGSTRRKYGGTGLGLSISKELAKLLGGSLHINSELTNGSEFFLLLPFDHSEQAERIDEIRLQQTKPQQQKKSSKNQHHLKNANDNAKDHYTLSAIPDELEDDRDNILPGDPVILIIEDDTNFAKALIDFSHRRQYKVISTVRGDKGIELAEKFMPKAILLDIELPVKNGWQVMDELKKNMKTRHIPVHIMSSHEVKRESITRGAIDFIRKPLAIDQIGKIFKRVEEALTIGSRKVLIIEENLKHAQALSHYLEGFDVKTNIRNDIQSGVTALKNQEADCVILDMGIPDHTAYQTLETIKAEAGMENLPVIIFTGKNLSPTEELKIKQYADSIVVKTAHSYERILDEVGLFLHLVGEQHQHADDKKKKEFNYGGNLETLTGKTVLIADDDIRNIFSLTKALEQHNMTVITASNGAEALQHLKVEGKDVDVVLMDMMMPEMDGYETITRIRQDVRFKRLPILAVTAKAMVGDREKCIAAGASDYISKPVDINQLVSLLRVWVYQ